jgi:DNA polymerase-1
MRQILIDYDAPIVENSKGFVSQKAEWLLPCVDHPFVKNFIDFKSNQKLVSTFLKPLGQSRGIIYPAYELLTGTGRTSCRKPNIQQQPRQGGIRDCILPPAGYVFLSADYSYIELCTLAQWLINMYGGEREMARMINSGEDPHITAAALLLDKKPKNVTKGERQAAKALNFGIAGGLSAASLKGYAKTTYDVDFTDTEAEEVRDKYLRVYPDVCDYLIRRGEGGPV